MTRKQGHYFCSSNSDFEWYYYFQATGSKPSHFVSAVEWFEGTNYFPYIFSEKILLWLKKRMEVNLRDISFTDIDTK